MRHQTEIYAQGATRFRWPWVSVIVLIATWGVPLAVYAEFDFKIEDGAATLIAYSGNEGSVTIPETAGGAEVVRIASGAFASSSMTNVILPSSVLILEDGAFGGCFRLTSFTVKPGNPVFSTIDGVLMDKAQTDVIRYPQARGDSSYSVPEGISNIRNYAFGEANNLNRITLSSTVRSIDGFGLVGVTGMTELLVAPKNQSFTSVDGVLYDAQRVELVRFPPAKGAQRFAFPGTVTKIGRAAFYGCKYFTRIDIPEGVASIGDYGFELCQTMTGVTLPKSLTKIGSHAFFASGLTTISIPNTVTNIGLSAFGDCSEMTAILVDEQNSAFSEQDGVLFDKASRILIQYPFGREADTYSVPSGVNAIGDEAFLNCGNLTNIVFPDSLTRIGASAFLSCGQLVTVNIPGHVLFMGDDAFNGCANLATVVLSDGVSQIGNEAFIYCGNLSSVTIPESVVSIGASAFLGTGLTNILIPPNVTNIGTGAFSMAPLTSIEVDPKNSYYSGRDGVLFNQAQSVLLQFPQSRVSHGYRIPGSVTQISGGAFAGSFALDNVTIPPGVVVISRDAFDGCVGLAGVYFEGDAPLGGLPSFSGDDSAKVYYFPGNNGWNSVSSVLTPILWNPRIVGSTMRWNDAASRFGFIVTGTPGIPVVIEASNRPFSQDWAAIQSFVLDNGKFAFLDSTKTNAISRFYRLNHP